MSPPQSAASPVPPASKHACWIERVVIDNANVRIIFDHAAPLKQPENYEMVAPIGAVISPLATHHSGCVISVESKNGNLGLMVEAYDLLPGIPPQRSEEWIPAL